MKLVSESVAPARTREIFRQVREALGVPVVPELYQAYAVFPEFLEMHWEAFRPALQSQQFFALGTRLAAESYTRAHNYFDISSLHQEAPEVQAPGPAMPSLAQVLDYYQYLDPLLLLISAAQMQAFEGPVGVEGTATEATEHPRFAAGPSLVHEAQASPALHAYWRDRARILELAFLSDEHRALSYWPGFYLEYWAALKNLLQSPVYADCQYRLAQSALNMVRELPVRVDTSVPRLLEAGISDQQVASVARMNDAFMQALTGLVLDVTVARIGCEKAVTEPIPHSERAMEPVPAHTSAHPMRAA